MPLAIEFPMGVKIIYLDSPTPCWVSETAMTEEYSDTAKRLIPRAIDMALRVDFKKVATL